MSTLIDSEVERFLAADTKQKLHQAAVDELAEAKRGAVLALREAGCTFAEIGRAVGLTISGVQRYAYKEQR